MSNARLFYCLCAALWLAGFFFSLPLAQPYEVARLISIAGVLTAAALAVGWRLASPAGLIWPRSILLLAGGLFWLLVWGSVLGSPILLTAFIAAATFSLLPAGAVLFLAAPDQKELVRICAWGGGLMLGALAVTALAEYAFFPEMLVNGQVRWPFANPASYAALLALGFFPALGWALSAPEKFEARAALTLCVLTLCAIIIIGSRGVLVATGGGIILMILMIGRRWREKRATVLVLIAAAALAFLLPLALGHARRIDPLARTLTMTSQTQSLQVRAAIWRGTAAMIAQHPLAGTGIGTFFLYYPQFRLPADTDSGGFMTHDDPLQFWAELGLTGPLLFYLICALASVRMLRALRHLSSELPERTMTVALFCALAVIVAHAHIDFDFYSTPVLCLFGPLLALWHRATGAALAEKTRVLTVPSKLPAMGWALATLPLIGILFVLQGFLLSEYQVNRAATAAAQGDMTAFAQDINRAGRIGFGRNARTYLTAAAVPVDIIEYPLQILPWEEQQRLQTQAENLLAQAAAHNPRLVEIPYYRASLAGDRHELAAQEMYLRQALTLDPAHLPSRTMLAELYNRKGDSRMALQILKDGLAWSAVARGITPGAAAYFRLLQGLASDAGDKAAAAQAAAMLAQLKAAGG